MAIIWTRVDWHDLMIAPDDLPDPGEEVLVSVENLDGNYRTRANVYFLYDKDENIVWYEKVWNSEKRFYEDAVLWYPVIAWAYYPDPIVRRY